MKYASIILVLLACSSRAQDASELTLTEKKPSLSLWKVSVSALVAGNTFDYATSMALRNEPGVHETNSLLTGSNGKFSPAKALAVKGMVLGVAVPGYFLARKHPRWAKMLSVINFGAAASPAWAGFHNLSLKKR